MFGTEGGTGGVAVSNGATLRTGTNAGVGMGGVGTAYVLDGTWHAAGGAAVGNTWRSYVGHGEVNITHSEGLWKTSGTVWVGAYAADFGKVNVDAGTWEAEGSVILGWQGHAQVNIRGDGLWHSKGSVDVGGFPGSVATVNLSGGTWQSDGRVRLEPEGAINVTGGAWTANSSVYLYRDVPITAGIVSAAWTKMYWYGGKFVLDGGRLDLTGNFQMPGADRVQFIKGTFGVHGALWGLNGALGQEWFVRLVGASSHWGTTHLVVPANSGVVVDGGTFAVIGGGYADLVGSLRFTENGGTIELQGATLIHDDGVLDLAGNRIIGYGQVTVGPAGLELGTLEDPGSVTGSSAAYRIVVNGDISGSGSLTHVTVFGDASVGSSAGEISLTDVLFGASSTVTMKILGIGPDEFDRMLIGMGVNFDGCPIDIAFAGGFAPDPAETFDLFDELSGGDLAAALATAQVNLPLDWRLNLSTGTLRYIPEPVSALLLLPGFAAALLRRGRE